MLFYHCLSPNCCQLTYHSPILSDTGMELTTLQRKYELFILYSAPSLLKKPLVNQC